MIRDLGLATAFALVFLQGPSPSRPTEPIQYHFTFPEPEHHWMQVAVSFSGLEARPLELRMSRSSPGRYSLHDFAKNVYDVHVFGPNGSELETTRPDAYGWTVPVHGDRLRATYKVFGDRADGTYLAVDRTHAHINMPAAIMWARGLDDRAVTVALAEPSGQRWLAATQLHAIGSPAPLEFTAPNLQYLMDSPVEFGPVAIRQFSVQDHVFRVAVHQAGGDAALDSFVNDVEKIVRAEGAIYGEYPAYEPGAYTFLADYLPYADFDGMEHRDSCILTSPGSLATDRDDLLEGVAHEFFHSWNVERIRPRSLEPFDFERSNMSGELWLAEGFTQYYGPLALSRAGLAGLPVITDTIAGFIASVAGNPAHLLRSAEEMSRMAPFTDGGRPIDRTNWSNTVISYYSYGGALALALDLTLRDRSNGQTTLDDYMRAMWRVHGKPGGSREGYVDRPYTIEDAEARLAEVAGDPAFAHDFFSRYVRGHDVPDYARLLLRAGFVLRKPYGGRASWGSVQFESRGGSIRLLAAPPADSPLYRAGLDVGDEMKQADGARVSSIGDLDGIVARHRPGDKVVVAFTDRSGGSKTATVALTEDSRIDVVPVEATGSQLSPSQKAFRDRWLR